MAERREELPKARLPDEPIDRVVAPVMRFLHVESASGVLLLLFTLAPLWLANSAASAEFLAIWKTEIGITVGAFQISHSIQHWINDGLMVLFFFVVGLEIKRELVIGELRDFRTAALPIAAALGGMIVPASMYLAFQWGQPAQRGWGISMATDIAFVVGCLALLGSRVPHSLRTLLLSLAIADDVGAILVIALGYTEELYLAALAWGCAGIGVVVLLRQAGVRSVPVYTLLGVAIWFGFHESGVHATIAGVILGLLTPVKPWVSENLLVQFTERTSDLMKGDPLHETADRRSVLRAVEKAARETMSPLERLEMALHPWVSFIVMPLFAFANAGVPIDPQLLGDSVAAAVAVGLVIGKPVGIVALSWLAVQSGLAKLPGEISWKVLFAGSVLAGIGFTMSLFIADLALAGDTLQSTKIGILSGSVIAAVCGMGLLAWLLPSPAAKQS